jgi:hypothetical protein
VNWNATLFCACVIVGPEAIVSLVIADHGCISRITPAPNSARCSGVRFPIAC